MQASIVSEATSAAKGIGRGAVDLGLVKAKRGAWGNAPRSIEQAGSAPEGGRRGRVATLAN